jgi:hypothetical protein
MKVSGSFFIEDVVSVDFEVDFYGTYQPYESGTKDYPGCDESMTLEGWEIEGLDNNPEIKNAINKFLENKMIDRSWRWHIEADLLEEERDRNGSND